MSKICSNCGHENRDVAIFCGNCGSRLVAQNIGTNFTGGNSENSQENNGLGLCCGVLIILFIIILIMSLK